MDFSDPRTWLALAILTAIYSAYRLAHAMRYPMVDCGRCHGSGRLKSGIYSRTCPRCDGAARRTRLAAKIAATIVPGFHPPE